MTSTDGFSKKRTLRRLKLILPQETHTDEKSTVFLYYTPVASARPTSTLRALETQEGSDAGARYKRAKVESEDSDSPDEAPPAGNVVIYHPHGTLPDISHHMGQLIEIRIHSRYLSTKNPAVQNRQLWGNDREFYTDDSDAVAMLMHSGMYHLTPVAPPVSKLPGVSVFLRVFPGKTSYKGSHANRLRSRSWMSEYSRCSLQIAGVTLNKDPELFDGRTNSSLQVLKSPQYSYVVKAYKPRKFVSDMKLMFNLSNEPCFKYNIGLVADRGLDREEWTCTRLRSEVIYLDSARDRFELAAISGAPGAVLRLRFSRVVDLWHSSEKCPLGAESTELIEGNLEWEEIVWGISSVTVRGRVFPVSTLLFKPRTEV